MLLITSCYLCYIYLKFICCICGTLTLPAVGSLIEEAEHYEHQLSETIAALKEKQQAKPTASVDSTKQGIRGGASSAGESGSGAADGLQQLDGMPTAMDSLIM